MTPEDALDRVVKSYDIRGVVGTEVTPDVSRRLGQAVAVEFDSPEILIGWDMRPSSPELVAAFSAGVHQQGCDTVEIGLASTDMMYFASGRYDLPGAIFTASHNPSEYNGIKLCRRGAAPIARDTGLASIRKLAKANTFRSTEPLGTSRRLTGVLEAFAEHVMSFIEPAAFWDLRVVVDAGNGMAGVVVPAVFDHLNVDLIPLFFELDGTFPNHPSDPTDPANLTDLIRAVKEHNADLGMAFDGDADRMMCVTRQGEIVTPSAITALLARLFLSREPGATILYSLVCSRVVAETITAAGGVPQRTRVGHSHIKRAMAETGAVFGGEHSAHYYFRENYRADSGIIAAVMLLELLSSHDGDLQDLVEPYELTAQSGEVNLVVENPEQAIDRVVQIFTGDAEITQPDGVLVTTDEWWFSLRPSNTESLLRLNIEASTPELVASIRTRITDALSSHPNP